MSPPAEAHEHALLVGSLGNLVVAAIAGVSPVWDQDLAAVGYFALGNTLLMMVGPPSARSSATVPAPSSATCSTRAPGLLAFLAFNQGWFRDVRPWVLPTLPRPAAAGSV